MRKGRVPYHLVEVLSCPGGEAAIQRLLKCNLQLLLRDILLCFHSGCLSGRGQAESEAGRLDKTLIQQMEEAYSSLPVRLPEVNPALHTLYHEWLQGQDSPQANILLHTQYKSQNQNQLQPPHMQWWEVESLTWTLNGWFCWKPFVKDKLQLAARGRCLLKRWVSCAKPETEDQWIQKKHILTYYANWKICIEHASFAILKKKGGKHVQLRTFCVSRAIIYFVQLLELKNWTHVCMSISYECHMCH